jgi:arylsulfatase A-like enzyme
MRPNIVLIVTDQHRADHVGFGGNATVQTPNLDALAARGTVFDRAYVANPICMPNRASILTGRMPSVHGTRFNGIPLAWHSNTFVRRLAAAGYATSLVGKAHFQNMGIGAVGPNAIRGLPPGADAWVDDLSDVRYRWEDAERHRTGVVEVPGDFYGFDDVALTVDHADTCSGHYYQWLVAQGVDPTVLQGPSNALSTSDRWGEVYRTRMPVELYPTSYVADQTIERIRAGAASGGPFFIQCSFPDPHHPFTPPGAYFDMYSAADIGLPDTFNTDGAELVPHLRRLVVGRGHQPGPMAPWSPDEQQFREAAAAEYGAITLIDDAIGRVLTAIDEAGLAGSTTVVVTADHGDMFGDHGLMLKGAMHYEACTRVPLVFAGHGIPAGRTGHLASSIDIGPTILDLAAADGYHGIQGHSLIPALGPAGAPVREVALIEEDEPIDMLGTGSQLRMRTIVTPTHRLTAYAGADCGELYDLVEDPLETHNLHADPGAAGLRADLHGVLIEQLMAMADTAPAPTHFA